MSKGEIFIVGAGLSLQGFDFNLLKDKTTIAVNRSIKDLSNATYFVTADSGIARDLETWVENKNPIKVLCYTPTHKKYSVLAEAIPNFDLVVKYSGGNPCPPMGLKFGEFQSGGNSGFCALQFAVLMNYSPIYLLGFDLTDVNGEFCRRQKKELRYMKKMLKWYNYFKAGLSVVKEKTDIEVFSCSPISKLNSVIPYIPIDKAMRS